MVTGKHIISKKSTTIEPALQYGMAITSSGRISATRTASYVPDTPPFAPEKLIALDEALTQGTRQGRARFSVFIGNLGNNPAETVSGVLEKCPEPKRAILIAVDPNQQEIFVVYGSEIAHRVTEPVAKLGINAVKTGVKKDDLLDGIINAIEVIANSI